MPNPETDPVIEIAEVTLAATVAPAANALVDTPNTDTTPFAARAEATGAAAPAVPITVARVPTTEIAMPAILSAASSVRSCRSTDRRCCWQWRGRLA
ncbi:hypothetical protein GQ600_6405 [Phytophthora cactorum]|nr:hypothetical protein GQ600_6405 [Phytophthora cactorum]